MFRTDILIAPFWDDIYTELSGSIYHRFSSDQSLLLEVGRNVSDAFNTTFAPTQLFIATWDRVAAISGSSDAVSMYV